MKQAIKFFLALIIFSVFSCHKEPTPEPVCSISNIQDGQEFYENEDIQVKVTVDDRNSVITSVFLYIDNKTFAGTSEFPYNFTIKSGKLVPGIYTLKVIVRNKNGKQSNTSVKITVKEVILDLESPDFVTFSDGKLPTGWITNGWYINPSDGYDDFFSLYSNTVDATVTAIKTCNKIEFRLKVKGRINLYLDGELWKKSLFFSDSWTKFVYYCPKGCHTFKWEFISGINAMIDEIKFEIVTTKSIH